MAKPEPQPFSINDTMVMLEGELRLSPQTEYGIYVGRHQLERVLELWLTMREHDGNPRVRVTFMVDEPADPTSPLEQTGDGRRSAALQPFPPRPDAY